MQGASTETLPEADKGADQGAAAAPGPHTALCPAGQLCGAQRRCLCQRASWG